MCLNKATWYCCKCIHIEVLFYAAFATNLITHLAVSTFLLVYSLWYAFIPLAITLVSHVVGLVAVRWHSFRLFTIFMIYEGFSVLALTALDVWLLIVMEIKPTLSFFGGNCRDLNKKTGACDGEVRKNAAIAGAVITSIVVLNILVLWPTFRNFFHYLRTTSKPNPTPARTRTVVEAAQVTTRAVPSAPSASESMRRPTSPEHASTRPHPQLYTIYSPAAEPAHRTELSPSIVPGPSGNFYPNQEILKVNPNDYQQEFKGALQQFEPPPPYV